MNAIAAAESSRFHSGDITAECAVMTVHKYHYFDCSNSECLFVCTAQMRQCSLRFVHSPDRLECDRNQGLIQFCSLDLCSNTRKKIRNRLQRICRYLDTMTASLHSIFVLFIIMISAPFNLQHRCLTGRAILI